MQVQRSFYAAFVYLCTVKYNLRANFYVSGLEDWNFQWQWRISVRIETKWNHFIWVLYAKVIRGQWLISRCSISVPWFWCLSIVVQDILLFDILFLWTVFRVWNWEKIGFSSYHLNLFRTIVPLKDNWEFRHVPLKPIFPCNFSNFFVNMHPSKSFGGIYFFQKWIPNARFTIKNQFF